MFSEICVALMWHMSVVHGDYLAKVSVTECCRRLIFLFWKYGEKFEALEEIPIEDQCP